tara:strand:- start:10081 stop:11322 length:1242 start_codon:yes stop_codon:yes gene_type:complete
MNKNLILIFLIAANILIADDYLIKSKGYLDIQTGDIVKADILVSDGKIVEIGKIKISDATVLSFPDLILLPGLMDSHVHIVGNDSKGEESIADSSHMGTVWGVVNAERTLMAGFTTVRNVGAANYADVSVRDAIERGVINGPTMLVSGPALGITGGHCDHNLLPPEFNYSSEGVVDSPWEARKMVRKNRKYGADLIKFCATGGVMSRNTDVNAKQFTLEEMKAIVDESHNHGMKVAAHAHGLVGIKAAIKAGVDSVEHASFIDDEAIEMAIQNNTVLSMDIFVSDYILGEGAKAGIREESLNKERLVGQKQRENFMNAHKRGAIITFGTDAGIFDHGDNAKQFAYMVEWGMTPLEAIQASTIKTAQLFGIEKIGQIKKGFDADIIGVYEDPLKNIRTLESVAFVMKEGKIYKK